MTTRLFSESLISCGAEGSFVVILQLCDGVHSTIGVISILVLSHDGVSTITSHIMAITIRSTAICMIVVSLFMGICISTRLLTIIRLFALPRLLFDLYEIKDIILVFIRCYLMNNPSQSPDLKEYIGEVFWMTRKDVIDGTARGLVEDMSWEFSETVPLAEFVNLGNKSKAWEKWEIDDFLGKFWIEWPRATHRSNSIMNNMRGNGSRGTYLRKNRDDLDWEIPLPDIWRPYVRYLKWKGLQNPSSWTGWNWKEITALTNALHGPEATDSLGMIFPNVLKFGKHAPLFQNLASIAEDKVSSDAKRSIVHYYNKYRRSSEKTDIDVMLRQFIEDQKRRLSKESSAYTWWRVCVWLKKAEDLLAWEDVSDIAYDKDILYKKYLEG